MSISYLVMLGFFALNVLTPGASFVFTISNAIAHGRRSGFHIALGLATADTLFATAATAGLVALVTQDMLVVKGISLLGGLWFVYGGLRLMLRKPAERLSQEAQRSASALAGTLAYRLGFTAGAFNAQAIIFFSAMFLATLTSRPSPAEAVALVGGVALVSALTRGTIVSLFTTRQVVGFYSANRGRMQMLSGGALVAFGLKLVIPAALVLTTHAL